jgi:predicted permease
MTERLAGALLRLASLLVVSDRREEWLEEWSAELSALAAHRTNGETGLAQKGSTPTPGLPGLLEFAAGALPHALWMRMEGWTMDSLLQDIRYSSRVLRRTPGFTLVAALTLALGIGVNAAIFSLVNGLVLRAPDGVAEPDRLVQIGRSYASAPRWDSFSWPAMRLIEREARTLTGVAGYAGQVFVVGEGTDAERVIGQLVSGNYFDLLGVRPHVGRLLQPDDDVRPGAHRVLVLSHALWMRRYGGDPSIVGRTVEVGGQPWEVVGVTPEGFHGVDNLGFHPQAYASLMMNPYLDAALPVAEWGWSWINLIGRLQDGTSFDEAEASMEVVSYRLREAAAVHEDILAVLAEGVGLDPEGRAAARQVSIVLAAIAGLVLLLACTNVANLFLARATSRNGEVGVRLALGAGRRRLVRQLMTETSLLAVAATVLAVPVVALSGDLLPLVLPARLATTLDPDARVYAFLGAIGIAAGLFFGAAPAWSWARRDATSSLRDGASTGTPGRMRLRDALVVVQLGLSLGLVTGAALLGRSVMNARAADPGFDPAGLVAAPIDLFATGRYDEDRGRAFFEQLLAEARALPGLEVTLASQLPIAGGQSRSSVRPADRPEDEIFFEAEYTVVGGDYFELMDIPVVRGRGLGGLGEEPERVVVVNEALASLFWPGEDPVGKELRGEPTNWRIVGLVPDVQMRSLRSAGNPAVYYPIDQQYLPRMALHLRGADGRTPDVELVRTTIASVDPAIPVSTVYDLEAAILASMGETRTIGTLVGVFALLALGLAAVGLYGLVSFGVSQRIRELGIRIALGARPEELIRLVLRRGVTLGLLGVGFGLVVSFGLATALQSLLFGIAPTDPTTFVIASVVLVASAGLAAWLPARRAGRLDAATSLREGA